MIPVYHENWFDIAIYYPLEKVNTLLDEAIKPLLHKNDLGKYHIFFSERKGENIRIHFNCRPDQGTLSKIDAHFKDFFRKFAMKGKDVVLPTDEFFLPFETNSVRYNMFHSYVLMGFPPPPPDDLVSEISKRILYRSDQFNLERFSGRIKFAAAIQIRLSDKDFFQERLKQVKASFIELHGEAVVKKYLDSVEDTVNAEAEDMNQLIGCLPAFEEVPKGNLNSRWHFVNYQLNINTELLLLLLICRILQLDVR